MEEIFKKYIAAGNYIHNEKFDDRWNDIFALPPLYEDKGGSIKVYGLLTKTNWNAPTPDVKKLSEAKVWRDELERKCQAYKEQIDEIDQKIIRVLKIWYNEAFKNVDATDTLNQQTRLLVKELREGRTGIINEVISNRIDQFEAPDAYRENVYNGVPTLYREKMPLIASLKESLAQYHAYRKAIAKKISFTDGRTKYTPAMKEFARLYYESDSGRANKMGDKPWVEQHCIPQLSKEFGRPEDFFNESSVREWVGLKR